MKLIIKSRKRREEEEEVIDLGNAVSLIKIHFLNFFLNHSHMLKTELNVELGKLKLENITDIQSCRKQHISAFEYHDSYPRVFL